MQLLTVTQSHLLHGSEVMVYISLFNPNLSFLDDYSRLMKGTS